MARLFRRQPDSSALTAPRFFTRVFCAPGTLVRTVSFYRNLTCDDLDMDMDIPEAGLHVVAIGPFLILELDPDAHAEALATHATVLVPYLDEAVTARVADGASVVQDRWIGPAGPGTRLRHPDGLIVEYLEHRPTENDATQPSAVMEQFA